MLESVLAFLLILSEFTTFSKGFHWEVSRGFAATWFTFGCRYRSIEETHLNILFKKKEKGAISHLKGAGEKIQTFSFSATVELADISEIKTS